MLKMLLKDAVVVLGVLAVANRIPMVRNFVNGG